MIITKDQTEYMADLLDALNGLDPNQAGYATVEGVVSAPSGHPIAKIQQMPDGTYALNTDLTPEGPGLDTDMQAMMAQFLQDALWGEGKVTVSTTEELADLIKKNEPEEDEFSKISFFKVGTRVSKVNNDMGTGRVVSLGPTLVGMPGRPVVTVRWKNGQRLTYNPADLLYVDTKDEPEPGEAPEKVDPEWNSDTETYLPRAKDEPTRENCQATADRIRAGRDFPRYDDGDWDYRLTVDGNQRNVGPIHGFPREEARKWVKNCWGAFSRATGAPIVLDEYWRARGRDTGTWANILEMGDEVKQSFDNNLGTGHDQTTNSFVLTPPDGVIGTGPEAMAAGQGD